MGGGGCARNRWELNRKRRLQCECEPSRLVQRVVVRLEEGWGLAEMFSRNRGQTAQFSAAACSPQRGRGANLSLMGDGVVFTHLMEMIEQSCCPSHSDVTQKKNLLNQRSKKKKRSGIVVKARTGDINGEMAEAGSGGSFCVLAGRGKLAAPVVSITPQPDSRLGLVTAAGGSLPGPDSREPIVSRLHVLK